MQAAGGSRTGSSCRRIAACSTAGRPTHARRSARSEVVGMARLRGRGAPSTRSAPCEASSVAYRFYACRRSITRGGVTAFRHRFLNVVSPAPFTLASALVAARAYAPCASTSASLPTSRRGPPGQVAGRAAMPVIATPSARPRRPAVAPNAGRCTSTFPSTRVATFLRRFRRPYGALGPSTRRRRVMGTCSTPIARLSPCMLATEA